MKKLEFLKQASNGKAQNRRAWMISAFSVFRPNEKAEIKVWDIRPEPWGYSFFTPDLTWEKIEDSKPNQALFHHHEMIDIDGTWIPSCKSPTNTSIGTYLFNWICLMSSFGEKFPYMSGTIKVATIEEMVAPKLKDTPKTNEERNSAFFYCDENIKFRDALQYLSDFSMLFCWSATEKALSSPDGIEAFKKNLLKKYEGKLTDPVEYAKFESELKAFDKAYLEGDPCYENFMDNKIINNSRKMLYLTIGATEGFGETGAITPVTNSLSQGWPTTPKEFAAIQNASRLGSYSRGAETVNGGVTAKRLIRAASNYVIKDEDCGTKTGRVTAIDSKTKVKYLVGRNIFDNGKTVPIQDLNEAGNYLGKLITVRSPQYCLSPKETICSYCADASLRRHKNGVAIPLTEMSAIVLASSMAKMHAATLSLVELDLEEALS